MFYFLNIKYNDNKISNLIRYAFTFYCIIFICNKFRRKKRKPKLII